MRQLQIRLVSPSLWRYSKGTPWAPLALLLMIGLLVYFSVLAVRLWGDSRAVDSLTDRIGQLSESIAEPLPTIDTLEAKLRSTEEDRAELLSRLRQLSTAEIMGLLLSAADEAGVGIASMTAGEASSFEEQGIIYHSQPIKIDLRGILPDYYRFLSVLGDEGLLISVSGVRIAGVESSPSAQLDVSFTSVSSNPAPKD